MGRPERSPSFWEGDRAGTSPPLFRPPPAYDFNPALPTPPFQTCHEADGDGNVSGRNAGTAHFHFDRDRCEGDGDRESVDEQDLASGTGIHSTSLTAATSNGSPSLKHRL